MTALDGLSFGVAPGRITGFLGANGAGKTTAMRCIFGIVRPDAGDVRWRGQPVDADTRRRFGYLPEQRGLYPRMAIADQLSYFGQLQGLPKAQARAASSKLLAELGLADRAGDRLEALSHGNQQRVQLAAALLHRPDLLVLDEPFSGLDPIGVEALVAVLRARTRQGVAVVFSSHQLDLVEDLCEDVVLIDRGRLVLAGRLQDIREQAPVRVAEVTFAHPATWHPPGVLDRSRGADPSRGADSSLGTGAPARTVSATVPTGADPAALLASAQASGDVTAFTFRAPSVAEIFRREVTR